MPDICPGKGNAGQCAPRRAEGYKKCQKKPEVFINRTIGSRAGFRKPNGEDSGQNPAGCPGRVGGTAVPTEIRSSGAGSPGGRDPGARDSRPDAGFFVPDGRGRYSWGHGICRGDCSESLCVNRKDKRQGKEGGAVLREDETIRHCQVCCILAPHLCWVL